MSCLALRKAIQEEGGQCTDTDVTKMERFVLTVGPASQSLLRKGYSAGTPVQKKHLQTSLLQDQPRPSRSSFPFFPRAATARIITHNGASNSAQEPSPEVGLRSLDRARKQGAARQTYRAATIAGDLV